MDRLSRFLPPRIAAPLATLAVAGLLGAVLSVAPATPPSGTAPVSPLHRSTQPMRAAPGEPRRLPFEEPDLAARVSPAAGRLELLRPVGFPSEETLPSGPMLVAPAREPSQPVEPPATLIPPANAKPALPLGHADRHSVNASREAQSSAPLGTAFRPEERSSQLEEIAREADRHTRRGYELASRGAVCSAQAEFIQALRLVAQGLDAEHRSVVHSQALASGLVAIEEAEDFLPSGSRLEADLDLAATVAGHRTPVLRGATGEGIHSMAALRCYLSYAQDQLAVAAGGEVAGSMALHALGKLHAARRGSLVAAEAKAVTFYQAALLVCSDNSLAANDLGVLLAQSGRLAEARAVFEHALAIQNHPAIRQNLVLVASRLDPPSATPRPAAPRTASAVVAASPQRETATRQVRWVDPDEFARSYTDTPDARQPPPAQHATASITADGSASAAAGSPSDGSSAGPWPWSAWTSRKK